MAIAPSFQDLLAQFKAEAQARQPLLRFDEGDIVTAMQHGAAAMADAVVRFGAQSFRETFIDGASGTALSALVNDHLNLPRQEASPAKVGVAWSRTTGGAGGTIAQGSVVATEFNAAGETVEYATDADIVVPTANNGPFAVDCTATVNGLSGNVEVGTVTRVVDQPAFDPNFTVTNAQRAAGGSDAETDEELRTRARQFFTTLRRGTLEALAFGARQVPGVAVATVTEDAIAIVTVRVSDANGNSNDQMVADVTTELENFRCAGTEVNVVGGTPSRVTMTITLVVRTGFDVAARQDILAQAAVNRIAKLGPGETLFLDMLIAAIAAVDPDNILDITFNTISVNSVAQTVGDIVPTSGETLRGETFTFSKAST